MILTIDIGNTNRLVLEVESIAVNDAIGVRWPPAYTKRHIRYVVSCLRPQPVVENNEIIAAKFNFGRQSGQRVCHGDRCDQYKQGDRFTARTDAPLSRPAEFNPFSHEAQPRAIATLYL